MPGWDITSRSELLNALSDAAEIEHALACQYLYTGFSLRRSADGVIDAVQAETTRRWTTELFLIARQEMEHMGIVFNLLTSLGAAPAWRRAGFPQPATYLPENVPLALLPFSLAALDNFIALEQPDLPTPVALRNAPGGSPTLQDLYLSIMEGLQRLDAKGNLFIGPSDAQVTSTTLVGDQERFYDVDLPPVTDLESALAAIEQIIAEGEGSRPGVLPPDGPSHYQRLVKIREEYVALGGDAFPAALPVIANPTTGDTPGVGRTPITDPTTLEAARVFNKAYNVMLMALVRFYAHTDETDDETGALAQIAFFPVMTMVIRPLGEVLTQMPAFAPAARGVVPDARAGPCFEIEGGLDLLPHKAAAWQLIQDMLFEVRDGLGALAQANPSIPRLAYLHLNVQRISQDFSDALSHALPPLPAGGPQA